MKRMDVFWLTWIAGFFTGVGFTAGVVALLLTLL